MFSMNAVYRSGQQRLRELHAEAEQRASIRRARQQDDEMPKRAGSITAPRSSRTFKPLNRALR